MFDVLQGASPISTLKHLKLSISSSQDVGPMVDEEKHLQMLTKPFSVMNPEDWDRAPRNTNGV